MVNLPPGRYADNSQDERSLDPPGRGTLRRRSIWSRRGGTSSDSSSNFLHRTLSFDSSEVPRLIRNTSTSSTNDVSVASDASSNLYQELHRHDTPRVFRPAGRSRQAPYQRRLQHRHLQDTGALPRHPGHRMEPPIPEVSENADTTTTANARSATTEVESASSNAPAGSEAEENQERPTAETGSVAGGSSRVRGRYASPPAANILASIEENMVCPITHELMSDPVVSPNGHTYERSHVLRWIQAEGTSPMTREPLTAGQLNRSRDLAEIIRQFRAIGGQSLFEGEEEI